jgi:hypothetical protein
MQQASLPSTATKFLPERNAIKLHLRFWQRFCLTNIDTEDLKMTNKIR